MFKKLFGFAMALAVVVVLAACGGKEELVLKVGRVQDAPHGTKSFADVVVVLNDKEIVAVSIEEYQVGAATDFTGVPNSDKDFGANFAEGQVLYSKTVNDAKYSANMASHAGATKKLSESWTAIVEYVEGKTVAELEEVVADNAEMTDVITGSTLADTNGYVNTIIKAAKAAKEVGKFEVEKVDIKLGRVLDAPHGTKSFANVVTVLNGKDIVAVSIEEYQVGAAADFTAVPNSDKDFGANFAEGQVLYSKTVNDAKYSSNMATKGGATKKLSESWVAIVEYVEGKTVAELEEVVADNAEMTDVITGSTLADTNGYVGSIIKAAKAAK